MTEHICERCHRPSLSYIMSKFNSEEICPACQTRERAHPKYPEAEAADLAAIRSGDYNFPGIGAPPDLYGAQAAPDQEAE